jgi:hypothetical protein
MRPSPSLARRSVTPGSGRSSVGRRGGGGEEEGGGEREEVCGAAAESDRQVPRRARSRKAQEGRQGQEGWRGRKGALPHFGLRLRRDFRRALCRRANTRTVARKDIV